MNPEMQRESGKIHINRALKQPSNWSERRQETQSKLNETAADERASEPDVTC